jgi:hypothetical protein
MKPLHIHTRAQNHPDKQKSHKSRYMSRIGGCSPALAAIKNLENTNIVQNKKDNIACRSTLSP